MAEYKEIITRILALESHNKKLLKEKQDLKKALKRLEIKVLDVERRASDAYHSSRDALAKIRSADNNIIKISDILRSMR